MKIYVGNLSYDVTEQELRKQFEPFGTLDSVSLIMDKMTGRSKGFGFVEMAAKAEAEAAIAALNGKQYKDRTLTVNEARPRVDNRGSSSSYGDRRSGGSSFGDRRGGGRDSRGGGGRSQQRY